MLSIPIPADVETMDGCPLVRLQDSAEDMAYFLKALLYPDFFKSFPGPTTFNILSGVLRMSHKYDVDALQKRALIHLSARFPTTLDGWDETKAVDTTFGATLPSLLAVVILARQVDALWILPSAFYRLCEERYADNHIINGEGGFELTATDKLTCLEILYHPRGFPGCQSSAVCAESRTKAAWTAEVSRSYSPQLSTRDLLPLNNWTCDDWEDFLGLCCETCIAAMKVQHQKTRESVWNELPSSFNSQIGVELERMKAEALR
ncbi:hypothetical protein B0H14DRAFT_2840567 [Mycena olivaceomarginata]|nr:hypothetical protein B0H14DRAFT_2840567 [Mycena olivaceomarginata]